MRATMDREAGILRRFKVAPITPADSGRLDGHRLVVFGPP